MKCNYFMKISVIIPTYKPQDYLWECLNSLVAQTFPKEDFEVILVLNGCCEPWRSNIQQYIDARMQGMNVNYIQTDEGGVSNARNIALDCAKGDYVTFIDDDDFISPTYLEELYEKATPDTVSLCYPYAFNDGKIEEQLPYTITEAYNYCINYQCKSLSSRVRKFFSGPCMKLIPMSFIQGRRFDVRFKNGEDSLFMFLISDRIKKVVLTSPNAIYYRRVRMNSAVTTSRSLKNVFMNSYKLSREYTKIYFSQFGSYNHLFYATRILGSIKAFVNYKKNTY